MSAQLALYELQTPARTPARPRRGAAAPVCAACRAREARYGFRTASDDPLVDRPRTLCFECFRAEVVRRQEVARAVQPRLPLGQTLEELDRRRRRAQIAARRAVGVR
ncbi:MAG: hypothetical protein HY824_16595 [Acidobacteria bacterium]|nr:hypothetical protein [Acidobacteriota bacterium]